MNEVAMLVGFVLALGLVAIVYLWQENDGLRHDLEEERKRRETLYAALRDLVDQQEQNAASIAFLQQQSGLHVAQMLTANLPLYLRSVN